MMRVLFMSIVLGLNSGLASAQECHSYTRSQKQDAITSWLWKVFDVAGAIIKPLDGEDVFEFDATLYDSENRRVSDQCVRGVVTVDDGCQVDVIAIEEFEC